MGAMQIFSNIDVQVRFEIGLHEVSIIIVCSVKSISVYKSLSIRSLHNTCCAGRCWICKLAYAM